MATKPENPQRVLLVFLAKFPGARACSAEGEGSVAFFSFP